MKQPKMKLSKSPLAKVLDIVTLGVFLAGVIYLILQFPGLPDRVPGHYDATGNVDRLGSKMELWLLPVIAAALWIGMAFLEKYPHTFNYMNLREDNIEAQYRNGMLMLNVLKNESVLLFSYLSYQGVRIALGEADGLGVYFMPIFLGVIFGSMIIFIIRMFRL